MPKKTKQFIQLSVEDLEELKTGGEVTIQIGKRITCYLTTKHAIDMELERIEAKYNKRKAGLIAERNKVVGKEGE